MALTRLLLLTTLRTSATPRRRYRQEPQKGNLRYRRAEWPVQHKGCLAMRDEGSEGDGSMDLRWRQREFQLDPFLGRSADWTNFFLLPRTNSRCSSRFDRLSDYSGPATLLSFRIHGLVPYAPHFQLHPARIAEALPDGTSRVSSSHEKRTWYIMTSLLVS